MAQSNDIPEFAVNAVNLASDRLGTKIVFVTDEFFGLKERMLTDDAPVNLPDKYDDHGKWMDGWETRRRRDMSHDYCVIKLGVPGIIKGVDIDTSHFTGNYPAAASIEGCVSDKDPGDDAAWTEIVPTAPLTGDAHNYFPVADGGIYNYLRFHIYPDGGVARLRIYGETVCDWGTTGPNDQVELSAIVNGGRIVGYSDAHYGNPVAVLTAGRGATMRDGWETRRRREPGNDWVVIRLGAPGSVERIEVDTAHFKGNFPEQCSIQAARVETGTEKSVIIQSMFWDELMPPQKMKPDHIHEFDGKAIRDLGTVNYVKLNIFPDGGVSRFRIFGRLGV